MTAPWLSAGVLTADLTRLGAELEHLRGRAAWAHVDVMDGAFCPQLTVGPAGNLDLMTRELLLSPVEVSDGKR
jgi:pentose-5-phosphate-3-epimerase